MLETLKIKLLGHQPVAKVTDKMLDDLLKREFGNLAETAKQKLNKVISGSHLGKNRISAAIIRLSNKDINTVDLYLTVANNDCRDVLSQAEYPRCSKIGFSEMGKRDMKPIYLADWKEYSDWLNS